MAYTRSKHIADIGNINGGGNGPPQNAVCSMPVSLVQVQPTLAELCGVPVPSLDGPSLVPQLRNAADVRDLPVYSEFNLQTPRAKYMLRRRQFKYTFRVNDMPELYDLQRDREEMDNLALKQSPWVWRTRHTGRYCSW